MRINLKKLSVQTQSGVKLGNIVDVIFETDGQTILQYEVGNIFPWSKKFLINRNQVVGFEEKKMIVNDNVKKIEDESVLSKEKINTEPVMMREE